MVFGPYIQQSPGGFSIGSAVVPGRFGKQPKLDTRFLGALVEARPVSVPAFLRRFPSAYEAAVLRRASLGNGSDSAQGTNVFGAEASRVFPSAIPLVPGPAHRASLPSLSSPGWPRAIRVSRRSRGLFTELWLGVSGRPRATLLAPPFQSKRVGSRISFAIAARTKARITRSRIIRPDLLYDVFANETRTKCARRSFRIPLQTRATSANGGGLGGPARARELAGEVAERG